MSIYVWESCSFSNLLPRVEVNGVSMAEVCVTGMKREDFREWHGATGAYGSECECTRW